MGLIAKIRHKVGYVWYWRARHWWFDTHSARATRIFGVCLLVVGSVEEMIRNAVAALAPRPPHQPHEAVIALIVWAIVALIIGIAVALSMHNGTAPPPDQQAKGPTTQDGRAASRWYGTCCITQPAELGWKVMGREPIYSDGGKK